MLGWIEPDSQLGWELSLLPRNEGEAYNYSKIIRYEKSQRSFTDMLSLPGNTNWLSSRSNIGSIHCAVLQRFIPASVYIKIGVARANERFSEFYTDTGYARIAFLLQPVPFTPGLK